MKKVTIEGFPNYSVSEDGTITNEKRGRELKALKMTKGYRGVRLYLSSTKAVTKKIHRLVALAFIDNPEGKEQVNHIDGDKSNNCVSNLEWCTNQENHDHKCRNGLNVVGGLRYLFEERRAECLVLIATGMTQADVARYTGYSTTAINRYVK